MLIAEGHDATHVGDIGLLKAADEAILTQAAASGQVIISADPDFGELLAVSGTSARDATALTLLP
jgi:predicted nuclease of predicted toxin-antitoxin system